MNQRPKVMVAMSGGVDSSVAAAILRHEGWDVIGCFMRLGSIGETLDAPMPAETCDVKASQTPRSGALALKVHKQGCCSISDAADARAVAAELDIPLYVCNFKKDFGRVIDYFVDEYASGRTPNPCVRCNDWLKFGRLHDYAKQLGCDVVASGHYARIIPERRAPNDHDGPFHLARAVDPAKDQSYVLFGLPREQLATTLFPVGHLPKSAVRDMAREFGLPVFDKPDSQEICFVPGDDYSALIESRRPDLARPGEVRDEDGRTIGRHAGQHRFTVGQRRGLRIAGPQPLYVLNKSAVGNTITVGPREHVYVRECIAHEANWLTPDTPSPNDGWRPCLAKHRYNSPPVPAMFLVIKDADGVTPSGRHGRLLVRFDEAQFAVAPGQAVVLYACDGSGVMLGGGWIHETHSE